MTACFKRCTFLLYSNACATGNGGCHENADCSAPNDGSTISCLCRPGFDGGGIDIPAVPGSPGVPVTPFIPGCVEHQEKCVHSGAAAKPTKLAAQTVTQCRAHCKSQGTEIFTMECPAGGDTADCYCYDIDIWDQTRFSDFEDTIIQSGNCVGQPELNTDINSGSNGLCSGPYEDSDGLPLGGFDRAAVYQVNPCLPNDTCDQFASCTDEGGVPVCTCNAGPSCKIP